MFPTDTRILVVDDSSTFREQLRQELAKLGYSHIMEAISADEALAVLRTQLELKAPVGLIISDWLMPGMSGLDFLKTLKGMPEYAQVPFIMVTTEADPGQVLDAAGAGVSNYIVKPLTPKTLEQKLANVWRKISEPPRS